MDNLGIMEEKLLSDAANKNIRIHPLHSRVLTLERLKSAGLLKLVTRSQAEYEYAITDAGRQVRKSQT